MVIKTFALPKLLYTFAVLENPSNDKIKEIIKATYLFLWDGKPEKNQTSNINTKCQNLRI
jgi:hypothetical protein